MDRKDDLRLVVTFMCLLLISWLVFLRFAAFGEFTLVTMAVFSVIWVASVFVAMFPVFAPLFLSFSTVSGKVHKRQSHAHVRNASFFAGYIAAWAALGAIFYFTMQFIGYATSSQSIYIAAGYAAIIAGVFKIISTDHINTPKIMSPELFFSKHWRKGHSGACVMGAHHAGHTMSAYWTLVLIMLLAGYVNALLLGAFAATVFAERSSSRPVYFSRVAGACFVGAGLGVLAFTPAVASLF
jgi:predicted metal-binding membrane protein